MLRYLMWSSAYTILPLVDTSCISYFFQIQYLETSLHNLHEHEHKVMKNDKQLGTITTILRLVPVYDFTMTARRRGSKRAIFSHKNYNPKPVNW